MQSRNDILPRGQPNGRSSQQTFETDPCNRYGPHEPKAPEHQVKKTKLIAQDDEDITPLVFEVVLDH
jgi:hypothetical protein